MNMHDLLLGGFVSSQSDRAVSYQGVHPKDCLLGVSGKPWIYVSQRVQVFIHKLSFQNQDYDS